MIVKLQPRRSGLDVRTVDAKGINNEKVQAHIKESQKLLSDVVSKLKSRSKASQEILVACRELVGSLEALNGGHPKDSIESLFVLVDGTLSEIYELDAELGGNKNPARMRLWKLYKGLEDRLVEKETSVYNPLEMTELTKSIANAFSRNPPVRLSELKPFPGSGVYALYYSGNFPLYKAIADANKKARGSWAIYVGKAGKEGKRKGTELKVSRTAIYERLSDQHAESIRQAKNLKVEDFWVRYIPIEGLFVPLCENMLIAQHQPLWNEVVDGFGNKHMGVARIDKERGQQITAWDLLHPGRENRASRPNRRFPTVGDLEKIVKEAIEQTKKMRLSTSAAAAKALAETETED